MSNAHGRDAGRDRLLRAVLGEHRAAGRDVPHARSPRFAIVPLRRTEMLLPLDHPAAAARAVRRRSAFTGRVTLASTAAAASRTGIRVLLRRARHHVHAVEPWPLHTWLGEVLGRQDFTVAAGVGTPRPNAKPVVQVLSHTGELLGVAKIATDATSDALVTREAAALSRALTWRLPADIPRVLGVTRLDGWTVLLQSPLDTWSWSRASWRQPPVELIAALGDIDPRTASLEDSPYLAGLRSRLAAAGLALPPIPDPGGPIRFGAWHGDLTPWNVTWVTGRLAAWDWERSTGDVPVGFDLLHWAFHSHRARGHASAGDRDARAMVQARQLLSASGAIDPAHVPAVGALYVAEMLTRFADPDSSHCADEELIRRYSALAAH